MILAFFGFGFFSALATGGTTPTCGHDTPTVDWSVRGEITYNPDGSYAQTVIVTITSATGVEEERYSVVGAAVAVMAVRARLCDGNSAWQKVPASGTGATDFRVRITFYDENDDRLEAILVNWDRATQQLVSLPD